MIQCNVTRVCVGPDRSLYTSSSHTVNSFSYVFTRNCSVGIKMSSLYNAMYYINILQMVHPYVRCVCCWESWSIHEVLCISACFPWSDLPGISPSAVVSSDSTTMIIVLMTISSQDQRFRQVNQRDRQLFLWPDGGALLIFDIVTGHPQVSIVVSSRAHWPDIISD